MEEKNIKYGLSLKFTKLEAPEVGLWQKTFQVMAHNGHQPATQWTTVRTTETPATTYQPPQQHVQHDTQQLAQQVALLTSKLPVIEQWVGTNQMTNMATQWPCSMPIILPIAEEQSRQYMHQVGQCQHGIEYEDVLRICPPHINGNERFP